MEFLDSIQERHRVENKRVVELGAGTGIVGMVATTLGMRDLLGTACIN